MARSQIGVEEYLGLVFDDRPEPDYVEGRWSKEPCRTWFIPALKVYLPFFLSRYPGESV